MNVGSHYIACFYYRAPLRKATIILLRISFCVGIYVICPPHLGMLIFGAQWCTECVARAHGHINFIVVTSAGHGMMDRSVNFDSDG